MTEQIKEIFKYREMIRMLVRRDLRGRYKNSVLGFLWTFFKSTAPAWRLYDRILRYYACRN